MAREIPLSQGGVTLVSDEDYEELSRYRWFRTGCGYAARHQKVPDSSWAYTAVLMHRHIVQPPDNLCVDHINRDRLDNRRCNLRACTAWQNAQNRAGIEPGITGPLRHKVVIEFTDEENQRLEALAALWGLNYSATIRHAFRLFAAKMGIVAPSQEDV